jgi:hypothetical protein
MLAICPAPELIHVMGAVKRSPFIQHVGGPHPDSFQLSPWAGSHVFALVLI